MRKPTRPRATRVRPLYQVHRQVMRIRVTTNMRSPMGGGKGQQTLAVESRMESLCAGCVVLWVMRHELAGHLLQAKLSAATARATW